MTRAKHYHLRANVVDAMVEAAAQASGVNRESSVVRLALEALRAQLDQVAVAIRYEEEAARG